MKSIIRLVEQEALKLHEHTTYEEKSKLFDALACDMIDGDDFQNCIYGAMTGNCYNKRAYELVKECNDKVLEYDISESDEDAALKSVTQLTNSVKQEMNCSSLEGERSPFLPYITPIEWYIAQENANIAYVVNLINRGTKALNHDKD
jgi:hypothetical protein